MTRVLYIDDSPVAQKVLIDMLNEDSSLEVVGRGWNGAEAVRLARRLKPDVIVMDVNMPVMDGWEATAAIMASDPTPIVLITATYDLRDSSLSVRAMDAGAIALVDKPMRRGTDNFKAQAEGLISTVKVMANMNLVTRRARVQPQPPPSALGGAAIDLVAIAASTGGPLALAKILSALPRDGATPIVVVQHITPGFAAGLVDWLNGVTDLRVSVAQDGETLRSGCVFLAQTGSHLGVTRSHVALHEGPPIEGHRPSATHLFRTVAKAFGPRALGVILTGMGADGAAGLMDLKKAGGHVLAQDEGSSVVYGMPKEAVATGAVDQILHLDDIALTIAKGWAARARAR